MKICAVEECDRAARSRGWCRTHYMRWWQSGVPPVGPIVPKRSAPQQCAVAGCRRNAQLREHCGPHGKRMARNGNTGVVDIRKITREGRYVDAQGYVRVKAVGHPNVYRTGFILEHTFVMSQILGRPLTKGENVHHRNGVRSDNRPENLELWITHQPKGARVEDLVQWAHEILDRYEEQSTRTTTL